MLSKVEGRIGSVEVARIFDCALLGETAQNWFPDFDREAIRPHEHWLCPDHLDPETGRIPMPVHSFVLRTRHHTILIDTCVGNDKERPGLGEMHRLSTGYLERLALAGVRPEDIDFVMCTHLHVDHVGWNTRLLDGRWVPTFPNARYVMSKLDFDAARDAAAMPQMPAAVRNCFADSVLPVVEAGQVEFVAGLHEMLDGFTLRPAPGHSPGHIRIELRSNGATGVFSGDLLHSPLQVPLWQLSSRVCWDKAMSARSRRALLEFCVETDAILLPGHFQAPHVGRIRADGDTFAIDFGW